MSNQTRKTITFSVLAAALVGGSVAYLTVRAGAVTAAVAPVESAHARILRTGVIRCGYVTYPPGCIKDPNTGALSGIFVDTMEKAGAQLGLRVDWVEEVGWGSMIEGLKSGRYDMVCSPVWANSTRAKVADFSRPLFYSGIGIYVRADDNRFPGPISNLNASDIRIATIDGEMSEIIAREQFQQAIRTSHPQMSDVSLLLLDVKDGRADATFVEPYIAEQFLRSHPGSLMNVVPERPVRIFPNTMMLPQGEDELRSMINTALEELLNTGYLDALLQRYSSESSFYPVARPYRSEAIKGQQ